MAIQLRRGAYENYDASKLKPAEVGVVQSGDPNTTDGKAVYIAINTNDVKRIPTADEMVDHNAEAEGIYENIVAQNQTASQLFQNTSIKAAEAEQSASSASSASASANSSMQRAETAAGLLTNVTATAQTLETGQQATASYSNGVFSFGLPKGATGNTGAKGDKGDTGTTPNLSVGTVTTLEPGSDATAEITGPAEAPVLNMGIPRGNTGEVSAEQFYKAFVTDTATGAIASFSDGADSIPMKDVLVHIESVQEGSGDPSPENVRPITGWTAAKVTRCGKNLLPNVFTSATTNGITFTVRSDGTVSASGTATAVATRSAVAQLKAGTYILSGSPSGASGSTYEIQAEINGLYKRDFGSGVQFDITKDCGARIFLVVRNGQTVENLVFNPMLRLVSDIDSTYEPYSGDTYDITFPSSAGTVYGGTLDVTSGVLTVTHKLYTFDGSENWVAGNHDIRYEFNLSGVLPDYIKTWVSGGRGLSNLGIYDSTAYNTPEKNYITSRTNVGASNIGVKNHVLVVPPSVATTVEELKAFLANTPEQWYAPLQTPQTYQLTPQEITSLLGENNVWADTGDSEIEYRADTKMYVDAKVAAAVSALS